MLNYEIIDSINKYLRNELWMDFEMYCLNGGFLELVGFIDEAGEDLIKITFESPFTIISNLSFTYEGEKDFISVLTGEKAYEINMKYNVTKGNEIFKLSNTNVDGDMYIIAKDIKAIIYNN